MKKDGNKHGEVTAQSMVRRAKRHRDCAKEHRRIGRTVAGVKQAAHYGAALANTDAAAILRDEAAEIRSHP